MFTPLKRIEVPGGDVFKILSADDESFSQFGEAYVSNIRKGAIKSWRRNLNATSNLVVVAGEVRFVVTTDGEKFDEILTSPNHNYGRLFVGPGFWFAFQGLSGGVSTIVNIISCVHRNIHSEKKNLHEFDFSW